jgi:polyhydroxyalkanoate synthase subunit PhaC
MPNSVPPTKPDDYPYQIRDPEEFARNMLRLVDEGSRAMTDLLERADAKPGPFSPANEMNIATETLATLAQTWMADPGRLAEAQAKLYTSYGEVWTYAMRRMMGEPAAPVAEPAPGDSRFKDPEWSANPYFDFWKQTYLVTTNWAEDLMADTPGLDARTHHKADFYLRLVSSALSPSNIPAMNPEVMRETFASNAANLVKGVTHLAEDMQKSGDLLQISQTDTTAFQLGRNLALTPGKVVFENDILQLIQYAPTTERVHETPIMIVPPWINKFYILDLTPTKSLIKYVVDQGFTVFVVSWVNPDATLAHKTFEDYMIEGVLAAGKAVRTETGLPQCNVLGYCVGGTMVATTLSYLAARSETPFKSVTFLTTQVDFEKAGDLLVFIDDKQLGDLEDIMATRGYLDGSRMANVFNMMRPRDLIWPYIVNNYMLGRKPFPFDLLYWNQDSTRMTAANHSFYLREYYHENRLAKGEMVLAGTRLDPRRVNIPVFELATRDDHIAPAVSVFKGAKLFAGPVEFVLAGSGHIAGVINPPDKVKYQYWTGAKPAGDTVLADWVAGAEEHPGSWWPHWIAWLTRQSGPQVDARTPGHTLGVIEDAPGRYVRVQHAPLPVAMKAAE